MDTLKQKKEDRVEKEDQFLSLVNKAKEKALTADESNTMESLQTEIETLDKEIESLEKAEKRASEILKRQSSTQQRIIPGPEQDDESEEKELQKIGKSFRIAKMFKNRIDRKNDDGAEAEVSAIAVKEASDAQVQLSGNIQIPEKFIKIGRKKSLLDVSTEGTDVVFTEYGGRVIPILQPNPVSDQLGVTFLQGLRGDVQFPRSSGDVAFAWETESSDVNETTPTFDNISLTPKRVGGYVDITMKMLKQSIFVLEPWLRNRLQNRYALTIDDAIFNGAGTNEPTGLFNYSGVGVLSLGTTSGDMTYGALMSMKRDTGVANARMGREGFVLDSYGAYSLSVTPKQASGVEGNFIYPNASGPLLGTPAVITNSLDVFSSTLHGIIYGSNWGGILVGTWGGLDILFDPYTQSLGAKVRFVCNAFMNVEIEQAAEFTICKNWTAETTPALT